MTARRMGDINLPLTHEATYAAQLYIEGITLATAYWAGNSGLYL